jgi:hypothetical protein
LKISRRNVFESVPAEIGLSDPVPTITG